MSTNVVTFEQRLKERIRENFMDLIPEDQLQTLVDAEVTRFRTVELPRLIEEELKEKYKAAIKAELNKPEYQSHWDHQAGYGSSQMVKTMIIENSGAILESMVGSMMQQMINQMRNSGFLR